MDKKDLFTIGEFSKMTGVSIHSLRYYDEIGALTPEYVDPLSSYRYYSFAQLNRLFAINICINSGIRLNEFKRFIDNDSVNYSKLIEVSHESINNRIESFLSYKSSLDRIKKLLDIRGSVISGRKTVFHLDQFTVWTIPHVVKSGRNAAARDAVSDSALLIRLSSQARKNGVLISPLCYGIVSISNRNLSDCLCPEHEEPAADDTGAKTGVSAVRRTGATGTYDFALLADNSSADICDPHLIRIPEGDYLIRQSSCISTNTGHKSDAECLTDTDIRRVDPAVTTDCNAASADAPDISISCAVICDDPAGKIYCSITSA